jgi:hypothetical protein
VKQTGRVCGGGVEDGLERFVSQLGYVLRNVPAKRQQELYTNELMATATPPAPYMLVGQTRLSPSNKEQYKGK